MTEDEAKTKWCPFVRLAAPADSEAAGTAGNRFGESVPSNSRCIASNCMAWRQVGEVWKPQRVHPNVLGGNAWVGWTVTDPEPDPKGYVGISPPPQQEAGYCGLAGSPQ